MNNIWYSEIFCVQILFSIRKFFMNEDIRSSVFENFSLAKIFGLRSSEIFHERRSSVFVNCRNRITVVQVQPHGNVVESV